MCKIPEIKDEVRYNKTHNYFTKKAKYCQCNLDRLMKTKKSKKRLRKKISIWLINHFFCGQRFYSIKRALLRGCGLQVGDGTKIVGPISFGSAIQIEIGRDVFLNHHAYFEGNGSVHIGDNCDIAPFVVFLTGSHDIGGGERRAGDGRILSISIGAGSWIGARSTLLGCTIENGCIVGCGSTVTSPNIVANSVVHGEKAKITKKL